MSVTGITVINGKKADSEACVVPDQGLNFGRGVFETIAVVGKTPIFLEKHCRRMEKGLSALGIGNHIGAEQITGCIRAFDIADCAMKVLATPENIVISTRENVYSKGTFKEGFSVDISSLKRNPYSHVVYHKTLNYTDNIMEKEAAGKAGFDEVIFTNTYGYLAEGSVSNLFFASESRIYTPAVECGLLNGIVRDWILGSFPVEEGEYTLEQLMDADEVFMTNSLMGIMPVRQIRNRVFGRTGGKCGEIQEAYIEEVRRQVEKHGIL